MGQKFRRRGALALSVDAKKTEIIGNYKNKGAEWLPQGEDIRVNLHDFGEKDAAGKKVIGIPYGVYNLFQKQGVVNVGIDHNTAEFAVESIRRYYEEFGRKLSSRKEILLLADAGVPTASKIACGKSPCRAWLMRPDSRSMSATTRRALPNGTLLNINSSRSFPSIGPPSPDLLRGLVGAPQPYPHPGRINGGGNERHQQLSDGNQDHRQANGRTQYPAR